MAYAAYFRQAVVGEGRDDGDLLWGIPQAVTYTILILVSPALGAAADYSGRKKAFLLATTATTVTATALLFFVRPGDVWVGVLIYIFATVGFEAGYIFYNAFLPEVSTPQTISRISGLSWGTGFFGGLMALVACMPFLARPLVDSAGQLDPAAELDRRVSFVVVALFFALFATPTFLFLRERPSAAQVGPWHTYFRIGFRRVADTLHHLREYRETGKYMISTFFYYGGIEAVIKFAAIYAILTFGIEGQELVWLFIVSNLAAVPGTLAAGWIADKIGAKRALVLTLILWFGVVLWGAFATTPTAFWVMACGVAIGMGSTQAIGRSFMVQLTPPGRESEFFGFYLLSSKAGAILAFLLFGVISSSTGNQRLAVLWLLPLFALGLLALLWINDTRAARDLPQQAT